MLRRPALRFPLLSAVLLLLAACGDSPTAPPPATLTGTWLYAAPALVNADMTCTIEGLRLNLVQNGSAVTGTTSAGTIVCRQGATSSSRDINPFQVFGTLEGSNVQLNIGPSQATSVLTSQGTFAGNTVTGNAVIQDLFGPPFTGAFTATRIP
jgi:hypothetical protein